MNCPYTCRLLGSAKISLTVMPSPRRMPPTPVFLILPWAAACGNRRAQSGRPAQVGDDGQVVRAVRLHGSGGDDAGGQAGGYQNVVDADARGIRRKSVTVAAAGEQVSVDESSRRRAEQLDFGGLRRGVEIADRKSTRLNSSHVKISYA